MPRPAFPPPVAACVGHLRRYQGPSRDVVSSMLSGSVDESMRMPCGVFQINLPGRVQTGSVRVRLGRQTDRPEIAS